MLTAVCLVLLVPVMGLAIDVCIIYLVRAKLVTASDAAALAAGRSLAVGMTLSEQEVNARNTATNFFHANFPDGYFSTANKSVDVVIAESAFKVRSVSVSAEVQAKSLFLSFLAQDWTTVKAFSRAERRDTNVVMILDRSGSMDFNGGCPAMQAAAAAFALKFANYRDRVGMVTFGADNRVDFPLQNPPGDFQSGADSIPSLAARINCVGGTGTASALWQGYQELVRINEPGALNVLMLMTDGQPNVLNFDISATVDEFGYNAIRWNLPAPAPQKYLTPASSAFDPNTSRSSCSSTAGKRGVVGVDVSRPGIFGIMSAEAPAIPLREDQYNTPLPAHNIDGCAFQADHWRVERDLAFIPERDAHGTSVVDDSYKRVERWPAGHPDAGRIRSDDMGSILNAAYNSVQNAARRIRVSDTAASDLGVIIYTVGLGAGVGPEAGDLLRRVANVRESPIYDSARPSGMYIWASSAGELDAAFSTIASDMLRLAR